MKTQNQTVVFGTLLRAAFPDCGKVRWVFTLADLGDRVLVAYCTSNPAWGSGISIGNVIGDKVTNLILEKFCVLNKDDIYWAKSHRPDGGMFRVDPFQLHDPRVLLRHLKALADHGTYGEYRNTVLAQIDLSIRYAKERAAKLAAKAHAHRR